MTNLTNSGSLNWRQRQKQQLHAQLYGAAIELFEAEGFEQVTVQQITERVGVAKGTFFNHFPSKEHVVVEWYAQITEQAFAAAAERESATAEDAVCDLFADMSGRATASPELLVAKSRHSADPLLLAAEQAQVEAMGRFLRERCEAGRDAGELAADLDIDFFVGLLGAVLTGTSRQWVLTQPRFDFPTLVCRRVRFVFGAAAPRGAS